VQSAWHDVAVAHVESGGLDAVPEVGDQLRLRASVALGGLDPSDVTVEVVYGHSTDGEDIIGSRRAALQPAAANGGGTRAFEGTIELDRAGSFGYTVRVVPHSELLASEAELGLVVLAQ
jgi:starch phosphorylase